MEIVKKNREEDQPTVLSATQGVKGTPSLAVLGMASEHLEALLQVSEKEHKGFGNNEDTGAEEEAQSSVTGTQLSQSPADKKVEFSQKSIFEAAGEMSKLQAETNNSLENELKNQLTIMEAQLKSMQAIEKFWEQFGPAWQNYTSNPDYDNFKKVVELLEQEFQNDPDVENYLKEILDLGSVDNDIEKSWQKSESDWNSHNWWYHLWHSGPGSDPHAWKDFNAGVQGNLTQYAEESAGGSQLFANVLTNGQAAFQRRIRQLFETVEILMDVVKILEGSKGNSQTAMFDMEALLMDLEQLQINTNTQKSDQQQQISQASAKDLKHNLEKIKEEIKKASEHHSSGGLFGFLKKAFSAIAHFIAGVFDAVFIPSKAANQFKECGEDLKDVGTQLFDLVKLIGQAVLALGEVMVAGVLAYVGDNADAAKMMQHAKKLGEDMLANPALKLLGDIAMVAIMVAAAVTGQEWLAGLMLCLFVASESGLMQKGTEKLADAIGGKFGHVIADAIVIVAITILSAGAGAAEAFLATGVDSVAAVGEEEGIEMVEMAGRQAANEAVDEGVDEGVNEGNNAANEAGEKQPSRRWQMAKRAGSMSLVGFGSTLGSSTLAIDILKTTNKKDSEELAIILELVQVIVAAVTASIGGYSTITQAAGNTARATEVSAARMTQFASRMQVAATSVSAVASGAQGGETIIQGQTQKDLSEYRANVTLDEVTQNNTDQMIKQTEEELKQLVKGYEELIATAFKTPAETANAELQALIQA